MMADYIPKDATVLDIKTKEDTRKWLEKLNVDSQKGIDSQGWKPILIRTNFDSFFQCLEDDANKGTGSKICKDPTKKEAVTENIRNTKKRIENSNALSFLKNTSIWMRFCDNEDWDGTDASTQPISVKKALDEFEWFKKLGLYDFNSAKEFIEYNVRAQRDNYLAEIGGHDTHVTPVIYSDECEYRDFFLGDDNKICFKYLGKKNDTKSVKDFKTEDVGLRILLVDDMIGNYITYNTNEQTNKKTVNIISCCPDAKYDEEKKEWNVCENCKYLLDRDGKEKPCKMDVVRKLLGGLFILDKNFQDKFKPQTYWADEVQSYCVQGLKISDYWEDKNGVLEKKEGKVKQLKINKENNKEAKYVQIIGWNLLWC